jgi:hypothetical protein
LLETLTETKRGRAVYSLQFKFKFVTIEEQGEAALEWAAGATQPVFPELSA